jgi:hypothetical protein
MSKEKFRTLVKTGINQAIFSSFKHGLTEQKARSRETSNNYIMTRNFSSSMK